MLDFLPKELLKAFKKIKIDSLNEIRLRNNLPISYCEDGIYKKLYINDKVVICKQIYIEQIINYVTENSIYSFDEYIKKGFLTSKFGERIGLSGEFVYDKNEIITIKNYSSLCIRIPHNINSITNEFFDNKYIKKNLLVVSKTGVGKTTFIRDLCKNISDKLNKNIVVIDERNEIAVKNNETWFYLGQNVDVLTYSNKYFGFNQAVRTLNPNYIICDELLDDEDCKGVEKAINSGVYVIATIHAGSIEELRRKSFVQRIIDNKLFDQILLIDIEKEKRFYKVYDRDFKIC